MTLLDTGHLDKISPIVECERCGKRLPSGLPHCDRCEKHHGPEYKHNKQCLAPGCGANQHTLNVVGQRRIAGWCSYCQKHCELNNGTGK